MRVLVIDDQQYRHQNFGDIFTRYYPDWEIHQAWNAEEALKAFQEHKFDLVFFDHDLGYGDSGSSIAYQVLDRPGKYKCPGKAIVHSANWNGARNIAGWLEAGGVPHLTQEDTYLMRDMRDRPYFEQVLATLPKPALPEE